MEAFSSVSLPAQKNSFESLERIASNFELPGPAAMTIA